MAAGADFAACVAAGAKAEVEAADGAAESAVAALFDPRDFFAAEAEFVAFFASAPGAAALVPEDSSEVDFLDLEGCFLVEAAESRLSAAEPDSLADETDSLDFALDFDLEVVPAEESEGAVPGDCAASSSAFFFDFALDFDFVALVSD